MKGKVKVLDKRHIAINGFVTSPKAEEILDLVKQFKKGLMVRPNGKHLRKIDLYEKINKLDPGVPTYSVFLKWVKTIELAQQKRVGAVLNELKEMTLTEDETGVPVLKKILDAVYTKVFVAGNIAISQELDYIKEKIDKGEPLTSSERTRIMDIFFKGSAAFNKQRAVDVLIKEDEREQTIFDALMVAAQYGKIKKMDIIDVPVNEIKSDAL